MGRLIHGFLVFNPDVPSSRRDGFSGKVPLQYREQKATPRDSVTITLPGLSCRPRVKPWALLAIWALFGHLVGILS